MSRAKVVIEESVVRVVTVGIQGATGPPGQNGASTAYVDAGDTASRARANHTGTQLASTISDFSTAVDGRVAIQKGVANGLATLGSDNKIPSAQLPALAITDTFPVASQVAMLALTAEVGDVAVRTDLGKSFILRTAGASTLGNWQELLTPTDAVLSVNGQTGAVSLTASGLGALTAANNLSDVASAAAARTNLGLGTAALVADSSLVHLAGTESLTGAKTFNAGAFLDKGNQVFDARAYGVVADGSTNDAPAINTACAAAEAAGGGIVQLPAGTINWTTRIAPRPKVKIRGMGMAATTIKNGVAFDWFILNTANGIDRFQLEDLTVDLNNTSSGSGVQLRGATDCVISRIRFKNGAAGGWHLMIGVANGLTDGILSRDKNREQLDK